MTELAEFVARGGYGVYVCVCVCSKGSKSERVARGLCLRMCVCARALGACLFCVCKFVYDVG